MTDLAIYIDKKISFGLIKLRYYSDYILNYAPSLLDYTLVYDTVPKLKINTLLSLLSICYVCLMTKPNSTIPSVNCVFVLTVAFREHSLPLFFHHVGIIPTFYCACFIFQLKVLFNWVKYFYELSTRKIKKKLVFFLNPLIH